MFKSSQRFLCVLKSRIYRHVSQVTELWMCCVLVLENKASVRRGVSGGERGGLAKDKREVKKCRHLPPGLLCVFTFHLMGSQMPGRMAGSLALLNRWLHPTVA